MTHETTSGTSFSELQISSSDIAINKITTRDLWFSLRQGVADFNTKPTYGVFLAVIYPLFALLFTLTLTGGNLLYLAFPMIAGLTLIGPVISVALFEMSRQREAGREMTWRGAFEFVHSAAFAPILALSLLMTVLYVAWLFMAQFIYFGLFAENPPASITELTRELMTTQRGTALMLHGTLVGFLFAFAALAISVVGFPLLLDKPASTATAISTSFRAVTGNYLVMALWGLMVTVLLAAGAMVFLIGLAAVLPILGHATWHLYRKVVSA